jgi:hydrogenase maturation protease
VKSMHEDIEVPEITVLGIGNVVLQDEGFGVRAAETLDKKYDFPDNVQVLDGGTLGMELLGFVTGTQKLLILDSINGGEPSGTIFRFAGKQVSAHFQDKLSMHEVGIQDVLALLTVTDKPIPEVVVIGAQPFAIEAGVSLTEQMAELLPKIEQRALTELAGWGVPYTLKKNAAGLSLHTVAEEHKE